MFKILTAMIAAALCATSALAQSPFDGTWKGDPTTATSDVRPYRYSLKDGMYDCGSCQPAYIVKADGQFQPVKGQAYWDAIAVTQVDDRTISFRFRKDGKVVAEGRRTISADGDTATVVASNTNNGAGVRVDQSSKQTRVGPRIEGAHLVSGSWKPDPKATTMSDAARTLTIAMTNDRLRLSSPMGETLDTKLGGDYAPWTGDPGKTMAKAALLAPNKLQLTEMRDDKVVQVATYTVAADGRTMDSEWIDPRDGSKGTVKIVKQ